MLLSTIDHCRQWLLSTFSELNMSLNYIIDHIFLPPKLPQNDDLNLTNEYKLCQLVHRFAKEYRDLLPTDQRWNTLTQMLNVLCVSQESSTLSNDYMQESLEKMQCGGKTMDTSYPLLRLTFLGS
jgi:hypothetical protein